MLALSVVMRGLHTVRLSRQFLDNRGGTRREAPMMTGCDDYGDEEERRRPPLVTVRNRANRELVGRNGIWQPVQTSGGGIV